MLLSLVTVLLVFSNLNMQTLFTLILVAAALVYVLARWLPAAWFAKIMGRGELAQALKKASASSCSEQCRECASDTCQTEAKTEQALHFHPRTNK